MKDCKQPGCVEIAVNAPMGGDLVEVAVHAHPVADEDVVDLLGMAVARLAADLGVRRADVLASLRAAGPGLG